MNVFNTHTTSPFHLMLREIRRLYCGVRATRYMRLFLTGGAKIDEKAIRLDTSKLLRTISKGAHLLFDRKRVPQIVFDALRKDKDKIFLMNLALSVEMRLPECSLKVYVLIRDYVSLYGLFMGHGYTTDRSELQKYMRDNVFDKIRRALKIRGLKCSGKKADIAARLKAAILREEKISKKPVRDIEGEFEELMS